MPLDVFSDNPQARKDREAKALVLGKQMYEQGVHPDTAAAWPDVRRRLAVKAAGLRTSHLDELWEITVAMLEAKWRISGPPPAVVERLTVPPGPQQQEEPCPDTSTGGTPTPSGDCAASPADTDLPPAPGGGDSSTADGRYVKPPPLQVRAYRCWNGCDAPARLYASGPWCDPCSPWGRNGEPDPTTLPDPATTLAGMRAARGLPTELPPAPVGLTVIDQRNRLTGKSGQGGAHARREAALNVRKVS